MSLEERIEHDPVLFIERFCRCSDPRKSQFSRPFEISGDQHLLSLAKMVSCGFTRCGIDSIADQDFEKPNRDCGASWTVAAMVAWRLVTQLGESILLVGQTERHVSNNYHGLLWKVNYVLRHLPESMLGGVEERGRLCTVNSKADSVCSACWEKVPHGDRHSAVIFDDYEDTMEDAYRSARDTTNFRLRVME